MELNMSFSDCSLGMLKPYKWRILGRPQGMEWMEMIWRLLQPLFSPPPATHINLAPAPSVPKLAWLLMNGYKGLIGCRAPCLGTELQPLGFLAFKAVVTFSTHLCHLSL